MIQNNYPLAVAVVRRQLDRRGWQMKPQVGDSNAIEVVRGHWPAGALDEELKAVWSTYRLHVEHFPVTSRLHLMSHQRTRADHAHGRSQAGRLIAIEGADGVGKTTAAQCLEAILFERYGVTARTTTAISEVSTSLGSLIGGGLRIKRGRDHPHWEPPSPRGEQLAILAARVDQWDSIIMPALCKGVWVITDRHDLSARAYRRDEQEDAPIAAVESAYGLCRADVTFVLDLSPDHPRRTGSLNPEGNRLEDRPDGFWDRVRDRYLDMADSRHSTFVLDAAEPERVILAAMLDRMYEAGWLNRSAAEAIGESGGDA